jgi:cytochrome c-type biogenesis protein CcmE
VVALAVAAALAVFLLYTSIAGGTNASLRPSQLAGHANEKVQLAGLVVGPVSGDPYDGGMRFRLRDIDGKETVAVVYTGSKPDLFRPGRHVYLRGRLVRGTFVGERNSLVTKCPSKYVPKKQT